MATTTDSISVQAATQHPLPEYQPGQVLGGRFEIVEKLGDGMLGAVYKARVKGGGDVALKVLRRGLMMDNITLDQFNHTIAEALTVSHPSIVPVSETGEHDGNLFYTAELVTGGTLRDLLNDYKARNEDVPPREVFDVLSKVLDVLSAAHPVLHRNLKPENIAFVESTGADGKTVRDVKLLDFAVAQVIKAAAFDDDNMSREGAWYLAPEMGEFSAKADPSSDLYSVGAIFYEMLTAYPPVGRYEMPSVIRHGEVSEKIDDLIEIALNPNPQDRFHSASDMKAALEGTYAELFGSGDVNIGRTMGLLGILILLVIFASFYFKSSEKTPEELESEEMARRAVILDEVKSSQAAGSAPETSDAKYEDMVWVAEGKLLAGKFLAYDDGGMAGERTELLVDVPGYWMDKYESHMPEQAPSEGDDEDAAAAKREFNASQAGLLDTDRTWNDAKSICEQSGKRLCTENEWEKACKGPDSNRYAYGNEFVNKQCPSSGYVPKYRYNEHVACKSTYGIYNLGGGAMEWTSTKRGDNYIVKPGALGKDSEGTRCAGRFDRAPNFAQIHVGFRCCAD
jgi:serine/threonine protein kinase